MFDYFIDNIEIISLLASIGFFKILYQMILRDEMNELDKLLVDKSKRLIDFFIEFITLLGQGFFLLILFIFNYTFFLIEQYKFISITLIIIIDIVIIVTMFKIFKYSLYEFIKVKKIIFLLVIIIIAFFIGYFVSSDEKLIFSILFSIDLLLVVLYLASIRNYNSVKVIYEANSEGLLKLSDIEEEIYFLYTINKYMIYGDTNDFNKSKKVYVEDTENNCYRTYKIEIINHKEEILLLNKLNGMKIKFKNFLRRIFTTS